MVSAYTVVNPSLGHRTVVAPPCFAKLAYSQASLALSPRRRSQSARAVRPASLAASAPYSACRQSPVKVGAAQSGLGSPRERDRKLRPSRFGRSSSSLEAPHAASSLAAFEATIEHAPTVPHQSLCFSCAARLPFVGRARSAHIRVYLVIEARARRFSSGA